MLFVALLNSKAGSPKENIARRAKWQYPEGIKPIAEYWLQTDNPIVVSIIEADSVARLRVHIARVVRSCDSSE